MPEWNGMEDFKNGMEDNLSYFNTNSILDFVHCICIVITTPGPAPAQAKIVKLRVRLLLRLLITSASDQEEYGVARKNRGIFLVHNSIPTL